MRNPKGFANHSLGTNGLKNGFDSIKRQGIIVGHDILAGSVPHTASYPMTKRPETSGVVVRNKKYVTLHMYHGVVRHRNIFLRSFNFRINIEY
jgi:hypothetical protein